MSASVASLLEIPVTTERFERLTAPGAPRYHRPVADPAMSKTPDTSLERFQILLRELFQYEHSDLDFGIYRLLRLIGKARRGGAPVR